MGDKEKNVKGALEELSKDSLIRIGKKSGLITTKPYGYEDQEDFLNGALEIRTLYTPDELLDKVHDVERQFGRVRDVHWGPRTLDLDIIMYDHLVIKNERLTIPHIDMQNRQFVLKPLAEINEQLVHPVLHKTVGQMLREVQA
jgi:dihydroneopterin aldolase/2-amino-4-hydroxy-6-hydroxymethyldihydropteridine diphosphokinase